MLEALLRNLRAVGPFEWGEGLEFPSMQQQAARALSGRFKGLKSGLDGATALGEDTDKHHRAPNADDCSPNQH